MSKIEGNASKEVLMQIPEPNVYYGFRVTKDTKLEFSNKNVRQKLEKLVLHTRQEIKTDRFRTIIKNTLKLEEGSLLLLEEENRGLFLPKDIRFGTMEEVKEEIKFIEEQISKIKE